MIACLHLPYFAATLFQPPARQPLLIAQYKGGRSKVYALCPQAEQAGVRVGDALSRARALCPSAQVVLAEPGRVRRMTDQLLLTFSHFTQYVEVEKGSVQTALFYLDMGKLRPSEGKQLAAQLIDSVKAQGFEGSIGLASNKFTALVAALTTHPGHIRLIPRGEEKHFLAGFSVTYLPAERETLRRLGLLGLQRIGQVAVLPRPALIAQFGQEGERLHRLANGEDARYVTRYEPPRVETALRQFDTPLDHRLRLETQLSAIAAELAERLAKDQLACREARLTLRLEDRTEHETILRLREQTYSRTDLHRVLGRLVKRLNLSTGIIEIEVAVGRLAPVLPRQLSLFERPVQTEPHDLLADLAERYGENYFYRIVPNAYLPTLLERQYRLEKVEVA